MKSSRIRALLREGRVEEARHLLGRLYGAYGVVVEGDRMGRRLGFPTANLAVHPLKVLPPGVFAVEAEGAFGRYKGVANVGTRPTLGGGKALGGAPFGLRRGALRGGGAGALPQASPGGKALPLPRTLRAQIAEDVAEARAYFGL